MTRDKEIIIVLLLLLLIIIIIIIIIPYLFHLVPPANATQL